MKLKKKYAGTLLLSLLLIFVPLLQSCSNNNKNAANSETPVNNEPAADNTSTANNTNGNDSAPEEEPAAENHEPVTLRVSFASPPSIVEAFQKKYPWITVELSPQATEADMQEKIVAMRAADTPIDVVIVTDLSFFQKADLLEDLRPYIEADQEIKDLALEDDFFKPFINKDGKQLILNFQSSPALIVVNKDLLEKNGMEMPPLDWTYDDMLEMAKTATDPAANEWGMDYNGVFGTRFPIIVSLANGSSQNPYYMNAEETDSLLDTPEVLADIQWVKDLVYKHHVAPNTEEATANAWTAGYDQFLQGKSLFSTGGAWMISLVRAVEDLNWDVLPFPRGKSIQANISTRGTFGILNSSKNKDAAYKYISFHLSLEAQKIMMDLGRAPLYQNPAIDVYLDTAAVWEGYNKEAIKKASGMCCGEHLWNIPLQADYNAITWGDVSNSIWLDQDVNTIPAKVEAWRKLADAERKILGW